ncbi:MAG: DUF502 domain-containing protein [Flavobacteriaceae bacterium]|nr:DUF502 domain-containing protein [Flavobacteriaceae bacterium]
MKRVISFIKTTIIGGLFFIIPIVLVIYIFGKVIVIFRKVVDPIADTFSISLLGGETTARILALILLILVCFIAGLLAKTNSAKQLKEWVEVHILSMIPGYSLLKGMSETAAGLETHNLEEVVLVDIEEVWQIGFLMERVDADLNAVFIPGAPNPMSGDVVFVKWDRLKKLDIKGINAMKLSRKLGLDSKIFLEGKMDRSIFNKES